MDDAFKQINHKCESPPCECGPLSSILFYSFFRLILFGRFFVILSDRGGGCRRTYCIMLVHFSILQIVLCMFKLQVLVVFFFFLSCVQLFHFASHRKWAEERVHTRAPNKMRDDDGGASIWCSAYVMDTARHLAEPVGAHTAHTHLWPLHFQLVLCVNFSLWFETLFLFVVFSAVCAIVVRMHCKRCCCLSAQPTRPIYRIAIVCA